MSTEAPAADAEQAATSLAELPDLVELGLRFIAIGPDQDGDLSGFRINLSATAQLAIAEIAQATRKRVQDGTLLAYEPAVLIPPQHWMYVSETDAATLAVIEDVVAKQDLKPFDGTAPHAPNIKMVAARFSTEDHRAITFYRIADSLLQFKKSRLLGLVQEGNVYHRLDPADVLLLRTDFDVVVIDGFAYFTKKATFERAFGFLEQLQKESRATFMAVTRHLRIKGFEELQQACTSQPQMMAKMASIKRSMESDAEYADAMTMDNLIAYIEKHPSVEIEVAGAGDARELVFDPRPARRFQILKLLDDDFLRSLLTAREYEAGSKIRTPAS